MTAEPENGRKVFDKIHKAFVESVLGENLESPMKNVYGGMILGNVVFIKGTLNRLEDDHLQKAEISHKNALRASCEADEVVSVAAKHYCVTAGIATSAHRNDIRKSCIYLMKRRTTATNREIGKLLGGMSGFAVAKAYQRMVAEISQDATLRKEIERLESRLSHVRG